MRSGEIGRLDTSAIRARAPALTGEGTKVSGQSGPDRGKEKVGKEGGSPQAEPLRARLSETERLVGIFTAGLRRLGLKAPDGTPKAWREAALLLLDDYTAAEIEGVIRWVGKHEFWRSRVLALPVLRQKFPQLLLQARDGGAFIPVPRNPSGPRNLDRLILNWRRAGLDEAEIQASIEHERRYGRREEDPYAT